MNDVERALSEISDIRSRLAASTRFRGYAPEAVAVTGVLALAIMLTQALWPERFAASEVQLALVWGGVLLAGSLTIVIEAAGRSRRQHGAMAAEMLRSALRTIAPVSLVCLALGVAVLGRAPEAAWLLPGAWQMLTGVAAFASFATMPRGIAGPAAWYLVTGAVAMAAGAGGALSPLVCGLPFVVGHLWIAWLLHKEGGETR